MQAARQVNLDALHAKKAATRQAALERHDCVETGREAASNRRALSERNRQRAWKQEIVFADAAPSKTLSPSHASMPPPAGHRPPPPPPPPVGEGGEQARSAASTGHRRAPQLPQRPAGGVASPRHRAAPHVEAAPHVAASHRAAPHRAAPQRNAHTDAATLGAATATTDAADHTRRATRQAGLTAYPHRPPPSAAGVVGSGTVQHDASVGSIDISTRVAWGVESVGKRVESLPRPGHYLRSGATVSAREPSVRSDRSDRKACTCFLEDVQSVLDLPE